MKKPKELQSGIIYYDTHGNVVSHDETKYYPAMSLRDYFAGQALIGKTVSGGIIPGMTALSCYRIADEMLKIRANE